MSDIEKKEHRHTYVSRYLCSVLDEMRQCVKTMNFAYLSSLIEEAQVLGNRMEAGLEEHKDFDCMHKDLKKLKDEYNELVDKHNAKAEELVVLENACNEVKGPEE